MSTTLHGSSFLDTSQFVLPPVPAKADAVRKLARRLVTEVSMGEQAADVLALAATDPNVVRTALDSRLPGLSGGSGVHLLAVPTRVWTPWVTPAADEMVRHGDRKKLPAFDPSIPSIPHAEESVDGAVVTWPSRAERDFHLEDNRQLYASDPHSDRLHLFPKKGGVITPLVLLPQVERFADGTDPLCSLRIIDGARRYYEALHLLERHSKTEPGVLAKAYGDQVTPEVFREAVFGRNVLALRKLVSAVRSAVARVEEQRGESASWQQTTAECFLASVLSLPAYVVVGTVDVTSGRVYPLGSGQAGPTGGAVWASRAAVLPWHSGSPAEVVATGKKTYGGLPLPEALVDEEFIATVRRRLLARQLPEEVVDYGMGDTEGGRAAAQLVWWCRAVVELGGMGVEPATAVAGFAMHSGSTWRDHLATGLMDVAAHIIGTVRDIPFPPADYREIGSRPDSLITLVDDAQNLAAVAGLSKGSDGTLLVHPRWGTAESIALAHLALTGALPLSRSRDELISPYLLRHMYLLSKIALAWSAGTAPVMVDAQGKTIVQDGQPILVDAQSMAGAGQLAPTAELPRQWLLPPAVVMHDLPEVTHAFLLRHEVIFTVPANPLTAVPRNVEDVAAVIRRWFPGATALVMTDWHDLLITGVMVGSVYVRLFDRSYERHAARQKGNPYPEGKPMGTKDVLEFENANSGLPSGVLIGASGVHFAVQEDGAAPFDDVLAVMHDELDDQIINEADAAFRELLSEQGFTRDIPVLLLPVLEAPR
ncbi:hypothetical protein ACH427_04020 [Streptomyces sp. NPDC020379]|uniref:hypothetical protein n=1 Tax=Streptomyces sp. NPDC020379 TaxID=3365071 RepID=UPI0037B851BE